jgi:hypothetical protein
MTATEARVFVGPPNGTTWLWGEERAQLFTQQVALPFLDIPYPALDGSPGSIRVFDVRGVWPDKFAPSTAEKDELTWHHDAVFFEDGDKDFNGSTLDESMERIDSIRRQHVDVNGWPAIGYHLGIDAQGRGFLFGSLDTQRAHVAKNNHRMIGLVFFGNFETQGAPTQAAQRAGDGISSWITKQLGRDMACRPHREVEGQSTVCPGGTWLVGRSVFDVGGYDRVVGAVKAPPPIAPPAPVATKKQQIIDQLNVAQAELNRVRALVETI